MEMNLFGRIEILENIHRPFEMLYNPLTEIVEIIKKKGCNFTMSPEN